MQDKTRVRAVVEASILLDLMKTLTGVDHNPDADGPRTALGDVVAHLMHYAEHHGVDFSDVMRTATFHYNEEAVE